MTVCMYRDIHTTTLYYCLYFSLPLVCIRHLDVCVVVVTHRFLCTNLHGLYVAKKFYL